MCSVQCSFLFGFGDKLFLIGGYGGYVCGYISDVDLIANRINDKICLPRPKILSILLFLGYNQPWGDDI